VKHQVNWITYIFAVALVCQIAHAQINSSSIIVLELVDSKIIMAADSRIIIGSSPPIDNHCKIAAFREHLLFGATNGVARYSSKHDLAPAWDAVEEAKRAIQATPITHAQNSQTWLAGIVDNWVEKMLFYWRAEDLVYHDEVRKFADSQQGSLTTGIFAAALNGELTLTVRRIKFDSNGVSVYSLPVGGCRVMPCAAGMTDIYTEYVTHASPRAKAETWTASPLLLQHISPEMLRVIRLVDLTIAYDKSGEVGGHIDAVEMQTDGSIHWYQRPNCPEFYGQP